MNLQTNALPTSIYAFVSLFDPEIGVSPPAYRQERRKKAQFALTAENPA
jgi:hypothetical protein